MEPPSSDKSCLMTRLRVGFLKFGGGGCFFFAAKGSDSFHLIMRLRPSVADTVVPCQWGLPGITVPHLHAVQGGGVGSGPC